MTAVSPLPEPIAWSQTMLRIGYGLTLASHGWPKLLGTGHGSMANPMASSIHLIGTTMGLPFAPEIAIGITILEAIGGLALAAGIATRALALLFVGEMIGICFALGPTFAWIDRCFEYPLMLALIGLVLIAQGGGRVSIDHLLATRQAH